MQENSTDRRKVIASETFKVRIRGEQSTKKIIV